MSQSQDGKDPANSPKPANDEKGGWEALSEESSGGTLEPSSELEDALREASDAITASEGRRKAAGSGGTSSADQMMLEALSSELQALKQEYEAVSKELEETRDRHVRLQAEFENFRRRQLHERQEAQLFGHQNLVKDLLSTVDNLERAIEHSEKSEGGDLPSLLQGVELVHRELLAELAKHGVSLIEAEGQVFDPALHEAMAQLEDAEVAPGTVVDVMQRGYQLRDRMLRPARVVVSKAPEGAGKFGQGRKPAARSSDTEDGNAS